MHLHICRHEKFTGVKSANREEKRCNSNVDARRCRIKRWRRQVDIEDVCLHEASEAAVTRSRECSVKQAQGKTAMTLVDDAKLVKNSRNSSVKNAWHWSIQALMCEFAHKNCWKLFSKFPSSQRGTEDTTYMCDEKMFTAYEVCWMWYPESLDENVHKTTKLAQVHSCEENRNDAESWSIGKWFFFPSEDNLICCNLAELRSIGELEKTANRPRFPELSTAVGRADNVALRRSDGWISIHKLHMRSCR